MGAITYSDAIAIAQIVYYSPALLLSLFIGFRQGFDKSSGWYFLITFCLTRIIGASGQLATISNPTSSTPYTIALVCATIGTSPLLLSSLGLISRTYYSVLNTKSSLRQQSAVRITQLTAIVALILCIVGATSVDNPAEIESSTLVHVGIVLFLLVFIALVAIACFTICYSQKLPEDEKTLLRAVIIALPFLFVKILYGMLLAFSGNSEFNLVYGSKTVYLCMAVLEEMVVVLFYVYAGLRVSATKLSRGVSTV